MKALKFSYRMDARPFSQHDKKASAERRAAQRRRRALLKGGK